MLFGAAGDDSIDAGAGNDWVDDGSGYRLFAALG